jgi:hypothetical protein
VVCLRKGKMRRVTNSSFVFAGGWCAETWRSGSGRNGSGGRVRGFGGRLGGRRGRLGRRGLGWGLCLGRRLWGAVSLGDLDVDVMDV